MKFYHSNFPGAEERENLCKQYIKKALKHIADGSFEDYWRLNGAKFVKQVEKCTLANTFYWTVWAIMMLPHDNEHVCNDDSW